MITNINTIRGFFYTYSLRTDLSEFPDPRTFMPTLLMAIIAIQLPLLTALEDSVRVLPRGIFKSQVEGRIEGIKLIVDGGYQMFTVMKEVIIKTKESLGIIVTIAQPLIDRYQKAELDSAKESKPHETGAAAIR